MFKNDTINQHFISQAEQRLNALNPAAKNSNQRIYEFRVVERDPLSLQLADPRGRRIEQALSFNDLFSFDVAGHSELRSNLESAFGRYEQDVGRDTAEVLRKARAGSILEAGPELINLFAAKFLNFLRNPYSVTKALNTIGEIASALPTDPALKTAYQEVISGSRPHQKFICQRVGLPEDTYEHWLRALFITLASDPRTPLNLFEETVKGLFESCYTIIHLHDYPQSAPQHICLLSDRGFTMPLQNDSEFAFEFNLASCAFVTYAFFDPRARLEQQFADRATRDPAFVERAVAELRAQVKISLHVDDLPQLARYNQITAFQCFSTVYAAHPQPLLRLPAG